MHCIARKYLFVSLCLVLSCTLCAQTDSVRLFSGTYSNNKDTSLVSGKPGDTKYYTIGTIYVTGNKKTKPYIINREISFQKGDSMTLAELVDHFDLARKQLMNTRLFNEVVVSLKGFRGNIADIEIDVKERWYFFPAPFFRPVDRNLSEWAKQGYKLDRVNYGAKLNYYNVSGRNDKLKAFFINGYTPQISFSYEQPNADKSLKHGYGINVIYSTAREVNYLTQDNQQRYIPFGPPENAQDTMLHNLFHRQVMNVQYGATLSYTYRPAIRTRHTVRLSYSVNRIDRAVRFANPYYFNTDKLTIAYPELLYTIEYNNADYVSYQLTGFMGDATFTKRGISKDMNLWQINAKGTAGWKVANKLYYGLQGYGVVKVPFDQPYINQRMLGYGDSYLRGLERYVIDGVAGGMVRNTLRKEVLQFSIPLLKRFRSLDRMPIRIYLKTYGDAGYVYNRDVYFNPLSNKLLYTGGAGLDIVTFYDFVFRFEYSVNQLGQKGLFLHFRNDF